MAQLFGPVVTDERKLESLHRCIVFTEQAITDPRLDVTTVVLTMYDGRTKLADQVAEEVRRYFGDKVLRTVIPRSVKVSEAPGYSMTIIGYDPGSRGALSYLDASREIAERGAALGGKELQ